MSDATPAPAHPEPRPDLGDRARQHTDSDPGHDPGAIFQDDGPINPSFVHESVRTLMRALPLEDEHEPRAWGYRRMQSALTALSALRPRDEIEIMLGVQALSAYHAAAACWRIGMNLRQPRGDSTRHITTAASAARTFDTLLKALERRQARPLASTELAAPRQWIKTRPDAFIRMVEKNCRDEADETDTQDLFNWTAEDVTVADAMAECDRIEQENEGLDLANTEGILPGGAMIMPRDPTPQQAAYIARRLGLSYKRQYAENLRQGIRKYPAIRAVRTGDLIE
jgi:hypothetical protein